THQAGIASKVLCAAYKAQHGADPSSLDFSPGEWNRAAFCVIGGVATTVYATNQRQPDDYRV
ncbi:MAG: hypothetical protein WBC80_17250, partial [Isosphaeraceae bacterium]